MLTVFYAPGFNGENDISALMLCCVLTHGCITHPLSAKRNQLSHTVTLCWRLWEKIEEDICVLLLKQDHTVSGDRPQLAGLWNQCLFCLVLQYRLVAAANLLLLFSMTAKAKAKVNPCDTMISY